MTSLLTRPAAPTSLSPLPALTPTPYAQRWFAIKEEAFSYENKRFSRSGKIWDALRLNDKQTIGSLIRLCDDSDFATREDWVSFYLNWVTPAGITGYQAIQQAARRLHQGSHEFPGLMVKPLSEKEAIDHTCIHILDETWDGFHAEREARLLAVRMGEETGLWAFVRKATPEEDEAMGVDFVLCDKDGNAIWGVQVKPETFYRYSHQQKAERYKAMNQRFFAANPTAKGVLYVSRKDTGAGVLVSRVPAVRPLPQPELFAA